MTPFQNGVIQGAIEGTLLAIILISMHFLLSELQFMF